MESCQPGDSVRLTEDIEWHELHIPKGTMARVQSPGNEASTVEFDGKYGHFEVWNREIKKAR